MFYQCAYILCVLSNMNLIKWTVFFNFTLHLTVDICMSGGNDIVYHCNSSEFFFNRGCVPCTTVGLNCLRCSNTFQCDECIPGKWGSKCNEDCGAGCNDGKCNFKDGSCTCIQGFYGSECKGQCSQDCLGNTCLDNGHCNCTAGHYLPTCNAKCYSACKECTNGSSCTVCPSGKFGKTFQNVCQCNNKTGCDIITGDCIATTCPDACTSCVNKDRCNGCTVGWFGSKCDYKCPNNCNGGCVQSSGVCYACSKTNYGSNCEQQCYYCDDNDCKQNGECYKCYQGFYGSFCNLTCTSKCTPNCNQDDGSCTFNCPANCLSCSDNASCTKCKDSFFGQLCNVSCNANCKDQMCSQINGHCTTGCLPNYYGSTCDYVCSKNCANSTTDSKCDSTGKCSSGCIEGFIGDTCSMKAELENEKSDEHMSEQPGTSAIAIGVGVGGVIMLALVVVLVFVVLKMRRNRKPYEDRIEEIDHEYHTIEPLHGGEKGSTKAATAPSLGTSNASYNHVSDTIIIGGGFETAPDDEDLEIDFDEESRSQKRKLTKKVEENVYYIGIQDIEKRKVKVEELAAFVAGKTLDYYEEEFDKFSDGLTRSCAAAKLPQNRAKNRYKGLYAYDATRVKVTGFDTDYINANYIDGFDERNAYIASLGPMSKQMGDFGMFWNMIWQQKVEKIVMVTNLMEEGKEKCEQYWPNVGTTLTYSGVKVTCQSEDEYAEFTRRLLFLNDGESERQLHHLHFTAWPDRGIPEDVTALIEFRHRVLNSPAHPGGLTLVHCSAGIGRTGTYIALDILTKEGNSNKAVEIPGCIINMRQNRPTMVQTAEQYEFLHLAGSHPDF
ncbi:receptor-type tyrosine-protein phosphatase mu-like [Mya arenaria]|uniref:receptor-type tyrosine-protein phosphatase mu-like n=1 Tax=Mya arenaria TaxID=6604 RepID=UPI0022E664C0|nr:receptor-type tyrosine-protein phosphatase mu-like [Mya arenaria]